MPTINAEKLTQFMGAYQTALAEAVQKYPEEYGFMADRVPAICAKMEAAIQAGTYNHDGRGFKGACKTLGIKHTRKAIAAFIGA